MLNRQLSRRTVLWLIPGLLTVHNAEEAVAFQYYLPRVPKPPFLITLSYPTVLSVLITLSALAFLLCFAALARPASTRLLWLVLVLEASIAVNVVVHLVSAVAVFHGYAPGLATAVLINAPFALYCFRRVRHEQWVGSTALRATIPAALALHGPILLGALWLAAKAAG